MLPSAKTQKRLLWCMTLTGTILHHGEFSFKMSSKPLQNVMDATSRTAVCFNLLDHNGELMRAALHLQALVARQQCSARASCWRRTPVPLSPPSCC